MWPINSNGRGRAFACVYRVFLDAGWQGARGNRCYGRSLISLGGQWLSTRASFSISFFSKSSFYKVRGRRKKKDEIIDIEIGKIGNNFIFLIDEIEIETRIGISKLVITVLKFCGIVELCFGNILRI